MIFREFCKTHGCTAKEVRRLKLYLMFLRFVAMMQWARIGDPKEWPPVW